MKRAMLAILVGLSAATFCFAELRIVGPSRVDPYKLIRLAAEGAPQGAAFIWDIDREEAADIEEAEGRLLFVAPPGQYKVKCRSVFFKDGKTLIETARFTVQIGEAKPVPPAPPDPPLPSLKTAYILVVEETEGSKASRGKYWTDAALLGRIKEKAHKLRVVDQHIKDETGSPPADLAPWLARAKGKPLPWAVIASQDGDALFEGPLPATPGAFLELLKKAGG